METRAAEWCELHSAPDDFRTGVAGLDSMAAVWRVMCDCGNVRGLAFIHARTAPAETLRMFAAEIVETNLGGLPELTAFVCDVDMSREFADLKADWYRPNANPTKLKQSEARKAMRMARAGKAAASPAVKWSRAAMSQALSILRVKNETIPPKPVDDLVKLAWSAYRCLLGPGARSASDIMAMDKLTYRFGPADSIMTNVAYDIVELIAAGGNPFEQDESDFEFRI